VKEENKKARARQKEQYDKRAKENRYIVGSATYLLKKIVSLTAFIAF
jgi:hypothetical protein